MKILKYWKIFASTILLITAGSIPGETLLASPPPPERGESPNIIYIMMDDLGYFNLNCYGGATVKGNPIKTPNIDRLAEEGMRFTAVYDGLVDFSDILPTFTQIARTTLPEGQSLKGRSFLPQLLGDQGNPRDWIYIHWGGHPVPTEREVGEYFERGNIMRYVLGTRYKLYADGRFYDMENDIHEENNISLGSGSVEAEETRKLMQSVLNLHDEGVKEEVHARRVEVGEFDMSQLPPPIDDDYDY